MITREHYIEKIRPFYDSDLIKILTGIRRCGKSVILEQIMGEIFKTTDNVIYLNFEDKRVSSNITSCRQLLSYVDENKKSGKCYLFFDEILQNAAPGRLFGLYNGFEFQTAVGRIYKGTFRQIRRFPHTPFRIQRDMRLLRRIGENSVRYRLSYLGRFSQAV